MEFRCEHCGVKLRDHGIWLHDDGGRGFYRFCTTGGKFFKAELLGCIATPDLELEQVQIV